MIAPRLLYAACLLAGLLVVIARRAEPRAPGPGIRPALKTDGQAPPAAAFVPATVTVH
jgi:hypothetical protein